MFNIYTNILKYIYNLKYDTNIMLLYFTNEKRYDSQDYGKK